MFENKKDQRIARIIELPVPLEFFDMLQDLIQHYGSTDMAILESIKSHHKEQFGTLDDFKISISSTGTRPVRPASKINTPVTDARLAKIIANGKKMEKRTKKEIEKVDNLLDKLEDLTSFKELKDEISSMKSMIERIQTTGVTSGRIRGPRADLSSIDVSIVDGVDIPLSAPERPLLDTVLDGMLFFDDEDLLGDEDQDEQKEEEKTSDKKKS
ncbi:MAG: hypothetical protein GOP50_01100 [Candidatus Heimdallarchaeota archaeon]|nr:hypothetical protein [Candidatus Heimdallarchaeota archaeon]